MIKSFRGQLADGEQDTIRLSTNNGLIGYKIKDFRGMANAPGTVSGEHVVKLYTYTQDVITGDVDFDDGTLLGVLYFTNRADTLHSNESIVIFENVAINQDIFITHFDASGSASGNYYLELEQIKLDLSEATVATLKDMRGSN